MFKLVPVFCLVLFYSFSTQAFQHTDLSSNSLQSPYRSQRLDPLLLPDQYATGDSIAQQFLKHAADAGVDPEYSQETMDAVHKLNSMPLDFSGLEDLRALDFITIDNDHSKDLDQAMYIEFDSVQQRYTLYYAIADAAYFLSPDSEIDRQAADRAFTTYLPGFDIPILPRELSEGLCSLNPMVDRRAVVVITEFEADGTLVKDGDFAFKDFKHAVIRSKAQLSYRKVQDYYKQGANHEYAGKIYQSTLDHLHDLGSKLVQIARDRGVIDYSPYELRIQPISGNSNLGYDIIPYKRYPVEYYNEQISVTANQMVGEYLFQKRLKSIHRYHPRSEGWKYGKARDKLKKLIKDHRLKKSISKYITQIAGHPAFDIALGIICRINEKAKYSARDGESGHYALRVDHYDHFTAPMRRYQDVIVHRILLASIKNEAVPYQSNDQSIPEYLRYEYIVDYADYMNDMRDRESSIERRNKDFVSSLLLYPHLDDTISGKVSYVYSKNKAMVLPRGHIIKRQVLKVGDVKEGDMIEFRVEHCETESFCMELVPVSAE